MQNEQRTTFYRQVSALRRRRRRVVSIYHKEDIYYDHKKEATINVSETRSYEDYYKEYSNTIPIRNSEENRLSERSRRAVVGAVTDYIQQNRKYKSVMASSNRGVAYKDEQGNTYIKKGGSPAWRHNNPGNLSFSSLEAAKKSGAIDVVEDKDENGVVKHRWGVFETPQAGENALRNKIQERRFSYNQETGQKRNIAQMISDIYAPAADNNDPKGYAKFIKDRSGIDVYEKSVSDLTPEEFEQLIKAIKAREGTIRGEIIKVQE